MTSPKIISTITWLVIISFSVVLGKPKPPCDQCSAIDEQYDPKTGLPADTPLELLDFHRYRFHDEKQRYFKVGETENCNENMRFFAVPNEERLGQCDCDWFQCSRPLLFDQNTEKCYWAWSRGPCSSGDWFVFGQRMLPTCRKHPCPQFPDPIAETDGGANYYFENPQDHKCYEAGTRGDCQYPDERLWIHPMEPIPQCRNSTVCYPLSIPEQQLCIQGSRFHQNPENDCSFDPLTK